MARPSIRVAGAALGAALLVALAGCSGSLAATETAPKREPLKAVATAGIPAVAIGDSISFGEGVLPTQAWPELVARSHGWSLTDLAVSGSGFVQPGRGGKTYATQVAAALSLRPRVILIAATRNDLAADPAQLESNANDLLHALRSAFPDAQIYGTPAIWGNGAVPAHLASVDATTRHAITGVGGTYLEVGSPLAGHAEWVQPDGIHPTADGDRAIANAVDAALASR